MAGTSSTSPPAASGFPIPKRGDRAPARQFTKTRCAPVSVPTTTSRLSGRMTAGAALRAERRAAHIMRGCRRRSRRREGSRLLKAATNDAPFSPTVGRRVTSRSSRIEVLEEIARTLRILIQAAPSPICAPSNSRAFSPDLGQPEPRRPRRRIHQSSGRAGERPRAWGPRLRRRRHRHHETAYSLRQPRQASFTLDIASQRGGAGGASWQSRPTSSSRTSDRDLNAIACL